MSDETQKKNRMLRPAPQTMRERAERITSKEQKPKIRRFAMEQPLSKIGKPFQKIASLKIWRPLRIVGRFIGRAIVPMYIRKSFQELRQVTWPNRRQTFGLTSAVILFSLIFGVLVAIFDFGLDKLFKQVILR